MAAGGRQASGGSGTVGLDLVSRPPALVGLLLVDDNEGLQLCPHHFDVGKTASGMKFATSSFSVRGGQRDVVDLGTHI
jgi:hypothetical protein